MEVEFAVTLSMVKDKRLPRKLRAQAYRHWDGTSGTLGSAGIPERVGEVPKVFVDVVAIKGCARELHASFLSVLLSTIDHEYAHIAHECVPLPCPREEQQRMETTVPKRQREQMAMRFERAGAWTRRVQ